MAEETPRNPIDVEQLVAGLRERMETQRASGDYSDDLSEFELQRPTPEQQPGARVRFRPELGFSSKRVIGRPITLTKRLLLRLQLFVFDDLAQQADEAIQAVERRLEVEIATRERLEGEVRALEARIGELEDARDQRRAR
jgi:hypothetical protein